MAVFQIFSHAYDYIYYLIAGMAVLSIYWFFISRRRRVLAEFIGAGKSKHVYKLDNTVAASGQADIKFDAYSDKAASGYLYATVTDGEPHGWTYAVKGSETESNLEDGQSLELFGRSYTFHSYLGEHKPYRGHFISIFLLALFSLIVQLYFSVYAGLMYRDIDPFYNLQLAASLNLPGGMSYWIIPFIGLFMLEALILAFIGIDHPRRITPEVILAFFLSFMGVVLFPSKTTFFIIAAGWCVWCFGSPILSKALPWMGKRLNINAFGAALVISRRDIIAAAIIVCVILPAVIFPGGNMTISLPVIGQVGDWLFIVILLLSMGRLQNIKKVLPVILVSSVICAAYFLKGETGTPATLAVIVLLLLVMRGSARAPAILLTVGSLIVILASAASFGNLIKSGAGESNTKFNTIADRITQWEQDYAEVDVNKPMQVQRMRIFSAAGGQGGVGLYNGRYRIDSSQTNSDFVAGVLFEELGMRTGVIFIILILLTAYGCYFQGVRAEKYHLAVICFLIGAFIALRVMINLASAAGVSVNFLWFRLGVPIVGLPMPFLSRAGSAGLVLFICLALVDAVKLSWTIKPARRAIYAGAIDPEPEIEEFSAVEDTEIISESEDIETEDITNAEDTENKAELIHIDDAPEPVPEREPESGE
ncbi:MAG: FtsW/RodA/SpoVE family cell cycle protein [Clostridiales bacterium]|jgi:cell division protein FtsW (lipid II flippase)|nr:FtsW/RodA/SpoVE family cell cycle protein [Clostridiales bacterium]